MTATMAEAIAAVAPDPFLLAHPVLGFQSIQMSEQMSDQEWLVRLQFLEEAQEYLDTIESALLGLGEQKLPREALDRILRAAHSIKGGAALMGFHELSQVAHRLEDFFKVLQGGRYEPESELERLFLQAVDQMGHMLARYRERSDIDAAWLQDHTQPLLDQLYDRLGAPTAADEQAGLATDAGGDMGVMLFESEIGPCLDRLEGALQDPDLPLLRQEFLIACAEMGSLGEMLDLSQFSALCNHGLQLCTDCHDDQLVQVCQAVLKPLRRSHGLVLVDQSGLIPESIPLSAALQAELENLPTDQSKIDACTTKSAEEQAEISLEAPTQSSLDQGESGENQAIAAPLDLDELSDCLESAGALDNSIELGEIFSLTPQAVLSDEESAPNDSAPLPSLGSADVLAPWLAEPVPANLDSDSDSPEDSPNDSPAKQRETEQSEAGPIDAEPIDAEPTTAPSMAEAIHGPDAAALDRLFEGMTPEDFVLEEIAVEDISSAGPVADPVTGPVTGPRLTSEADSAIAESSAPVTSTLQVESTLQDFADLAVSAMEALTKPADTAEAEARQALSPSEPRESPASASPTKRRSPYALPALDADAVAGEFLKTEAFDLDLDELADLPGLAQSGAANLTADALAINPAAAEAKAIDLQAEQLTHEMLQEAEPEPSAPQSQDTSIRVSVRKLERLGELLGELTTERNGLGLQLNYLSNLFGLLNQRVKSLDQANNILRRSYDRGATEQRSSSTSSSASAADGQPPVSSQSQRSPSTNRGFDLLEMDQYSELHLVSQEIIESVVQIQEVSSDIELALGETETVSRGLNRTAQQLQVSMNQMRMRPLSVITDRFPRLLRELSMSYGKQVDLQVRGGSTLIERSIIEALQDPLMHLLRNCFDHGIEDAESRTAQGKPANGTIEIGASYRGNQVAITIQDDGAGINLAKIRQKVLAMGLSPAEIEASGDQELVNLIFEPGFSTAEKVTSLSGRGVGMDVVRNNLRDIQGDITVTTLPGEGSTFTLTVPLSLSVTRVLVVECQGMLMAFPANIVEEMLLLEQQKIVQAAEKSLLEWQGYTMPLLRLQDWLHFVRPLIKVETESAPIIDQPSALVVTHGDEPYAIECDRYWGKQEVTTRTVEGNITLPQGFSGCVVLGDGRVVPLVEMAKLMNWILRDAQRQDMSEHKLNLPMAMSSKHTVLVIDDSINVRRFLSITLEKAGYHVEQAKDGQDAIEKLQDGITPDVIMSDVEMPRLDGFGFLAQVKSIDNCGDIPVVMLTSRSGDKHRQLAMSLGAAGYFSKPFKQNELLQTLAQLIELSAPLAVALPNLAAV